MSKTQTAKRTNGTAQTSAEEAAANAAALEQQLEELEKQIDGKETERDDLGRQADSADRDVLHTKALVELGEASQKEVEKAQREAADAREKARVAEETVSVLTERYRLLEGRWQAERDQFRRIRHAELCEQIKDQTVEVWNLILRLRGAVLRMSELREECQSVRVQPPHQNPVHPMLREIVGADHRDLRRSQGLATPLRELLDAGYAVDFDEGTVSRNG